MFQVCQGVQTALVDSNIKYFDIFKVKVNTKKKIIVGLLILLIILIISLVLYGVLNTTKNREFPREPFTLKDFGKSELEVEISSDIDTLSEVASVYTISPMFYKTSIENMLIDLNLNLQEAPISNSEYVEWEGAGNRFTYDLISNIFTFELSRAISLGSEEKAFENIFQEYFDRNYSFTIGQTDVSSDDLVSLYAKRIVEGVPIERGYGYEYSDILRFDSRGYVKSGSLLLSEIEQEPVSVPLITIDELVKYVNLEGYPKESYVYASQLIDSLGLFYLDPRWEEIHSSAQNCNSNTLDLIYLYKSVDQNYLYPTYKVSATCEVEFEDVYYSVPAVFYLNAIDPEYVYIE
jgi:hypothetical protein